MIKAWRETLELIRQAFYDCLLPDWDQKAFDRLPRQIPREKKNKVNDFVDAAVTITDEVIVLASDILNRWKASELLRDPSQEETIEKMYEQYKKRLFRLK